MKIPVKKIEAWIKNLSSREKMLVGASALFVVFWLINIPVTALQDYVADTHRLITARTRDLEQIPHLIRRNHLLDSRLKKLQDTFNESQMTFEQVTTELDKVVRTSIGGNENYDLKKTSQPSPFGLNFEKQDFTLNIRSLTLEQLVNLLYNLEQGKRPLFLGKLDILQSGPSGTLSVTLEIYSISKQKA